MVSPFLAESWIKGWSKLLGYTRKAVTKSLKYEGIWGLARNIEPRKNELEKPRVVHSR